MGSSSCPDDDERPAGFSLRPRQKLLLHSSARCRAGAVVASHFINSATHRPSKELVSRWLPDMTTATAPDRSPRSCPRLSIQDPIRAPDNAEQGAGPVGKERIMWRRSFGRAAPGGHVLTRLGAQATTERTHDGGARHAAFQLGDNPKVNSIESISVVGGPGIQSDVADADRISWPTSAPGVG